MMAMRVPPDSALYRFVTTNQARLAAVWVGHPKVGLPSCKSMSSLWDKPAVVKPVKVSWLVQSEPAMPQAIRTSIREETKSTP